MKKHGFIMTAAAAILAGAMTAGASQAQDVIKIGASAPKSGPLAGGAAVTHWPNLQLWVHTVNAAGGIKVGDKMMTVELTEYDDRTSNEEAVKNYERLATVDKVDFIVVPYGTGINLATAPVIARHGYPQIATTAITDKADEFAERWPNTFWTLGTSTGFAAAVADVLKGMRDDGIIGNRVAVVNVADAFGIELANAGKPALEAAGFEIVYDSSYPLGTQDLAPVINGAKAAAADAFVGFSYPPDTFALTEQAKISDLGVNPDTAEMQAYYKAHQEVTGAAADYWASPVVYASLEMLQQAIERAGTLDRAAVIDQIRNGSFETVMGTITLDGNVNRKFWTVGQWQDGKFYGVSSTGLEGAQAPIAKDGWN